MGTDSDARPGARMTGFIVDADTPGITVGEKLVNMGQRASDTRPIFFEDVVVPKANALDEAMKYSLERKTMGMPIAQHQSVSNMLADMSTGIEAGRLLTYKSAYEIDQGRSNTLFA